MTAWSSLDETVTVKERPVIVWPSAGLFQNSVGAVESDEREYTL
jgi:hypothetical protein